MFVESAEEGGMWQTCAFSAASGHCGRRCEMRWERWEVVVPQPAVQQSRLVESSAKDEAVVVYVTGAPTDSAASR